MIGRSLAVKDFWGLDDGLLVADSQWQYSQFQRRRRSLQNLLPRTILGRGYKRLTSNLYFVQDEGEDQSIRIIRI